jgi:cytochrome c oxidase cbb3-type subunit 3
MSEEKTFDGIISADNKMPGWYIISFIGTIVFAVAYLAIYQTGNWSEAQQFQEEVAALEAKYGKADDLPSTGGNPFRGDAAAIAAGGKTFAARCAVCHKADATGQIGPNLTDKTWLHDSNGDGIMTEDEVFDVVSKGRAVPKQNPPMGPMPAHEPIIGKRGVWEVIAYLSDKFGNIAPVN